MYSILLDLRNYTASLTELINSVVRGKKLVSCGGRGLTSFTLPT